eukprot:TRINITY_DN5041_c0_g1_i1.p1 TRINITY_DN5041_c0_g1~~TRINITY_DN5041_c0_g1_i1.p1  ORF type:complete len:406 (-),score=147.40 TRINITY_DN5041_c0_g1_i1:101-1318(-)
MSIKLRNEKNTSIFQQYFFKDVIGEGLCSKVHWVEHIYSRKRFAVKYINKSSLNDKFLLRLKDEVDILVELGEHKHPNILTYFECYVSPTHISLVTELCEGGDLYEKIISRPPFREEEAAPIFFQIIAVVAFLHSLGIVHRDLKPENILLKNHSPESPIILADFGFAKHASNNLMTSDVGTPDYAAPEILTQGMYTKSVDVWACGAIIYFMLFGIPPFYDDDTSVTLHKVCAGMPLVFTHPISSQVHHLITGMMDRNTKTRFSSTSLIDHPWFSFFIQPQVIQQAKSRIPFVPTFSKPNTSIAKLNGSLGPEAAMALRNQNSPVPSCASPQAGAAGSHTPAINVTVSENSATKSEAAQGVPQEGAKDGEDATPIPFSRLNPELRSSQMRTSISKIIDFLRDGTKE